MKCQMTGCRNNDATWMPVLVLKPPVEYEEAAHSAGQARIQFNIRICDAHKTSCAVADILTNEGWNQICGQIMAMGRVVPDRERTELLWEQLEGSLVHQVARHRDN